jgi:DegV family protein with EDD domain
MTFEIITDSSANLPEEIIERENIHILSLSFYVEGKEYKSYQKGIRTDLSQFYSMMREKKDITTSLADAGMTYSILSELVKQNKDVLYIGFSSNLSGTFQMVRNVVNIVQEEYPDCHIQTVDTLAAALGEGLLVKYAIDMRKDGKTLEEVYDWLMENRLHLCHWFTVDDLFFLKRGGRISAMTAILGTALNIKTVLHVDDDGRLIPIQNVRGRKKALDSLVLHMEKTVQEPEQQTIFINHGDCYEDAAYLANQIRERMQPKDILIRILEPVIGAHAGPGTIALFFLGDKR